MSILTPDQQIVLEWLVGLKNDNLIKETFRVSWNTPDGTVIDDKIEVIPELTIGTLDAFWNGKLLICKPVNIKWATQSSWTPHLEPPEAFRDCTFTGRAYAYLAKHQICADGNTLLEKMTTRFNEKELKDIFGNYFLALDEVPHDQRHRSGYANYLIDTFTSSGQLDTLIEYLDELRPEEFKESPS